MVRFAGLALALSVFAAGAAAGADIVVRATLNPQRAQVGEPLTLSIEISGAQNVPAATLGNIDGFNVQYVGPSTQVSIVNGNISSSVQHRYSLLPWQPGHYTLGPFAVEYQGKQYQTSSFSVDIVAAGQPGAAAPGQSAGPQAQSGNPSAAGPKSLRLVLSIPQTEVYLHEKIPLDLTLYVGAIRVADVQYPTLPGDDLSIDKFPEPSQHQQVIDGETFQVLHFQTTIIPLRAGTLALGPAALRLNILNRRRDRLFNDPFFDHFFQDNPFNTERRPFDLHSDPLTLTVLPLPEQGKPMGFSGAVGSFKLDVTAAPTELNAGDPITLRMNLSGSGNLGDAGAPEISSPDAFRTYEPHPAKADGVLKSFEQVLIPHDAGVHAIPPVRFSYFDPQERRYETLESQPIALVVRPPLSAPRAEVVTGGAPALRVQPEEKLGRDIVYIKDDPGHLVARGTRWYRSVAFVLWHPLPLAFFLATVWYDRRRQRLSGDVRYARFTVAGKQARRGLAAAGEALNRADRQRFYDLISRTLQEYLAAKLDLPPGAIDADAVAGRGVSNECVQRLRNFFDTCEQIRFAPGSSDGDMRGTLDLAQDVVRRLEREQRLSPPASAVPSALPFAGDSLRSGTSALLVLFLLTPATVRAGEAPPASPQTTFFHANALYKDGQYEAAAKEYEQLLAAGLESGNLYFNLGNAYVKAGENGRAILNYERARRVIPNDPDLAANLAYAQSLTGADSCAPPVWQRLLFPLAHRLATGQLVGAASALYTALFIALAAHRLWPRRSRWLTYASGTLAAFVVLATSSLAHQVLADGQRYAVVIGSGETAARFEPASTGTVHFVLREGALIRILDQREGWLQVVRCDGRRGWLERQAVEDL